MYDTIIVGAGIAGLLTALRLSIAGQKVLVIDKEKVGHGSTSSNHGMVHSGALYVLQHGHIVRQCQEAQEAFSTLLPQAEIKTEKSIYIASKEQLKVFTNKLDYYGFTYDYIDKKNVPEINKNSIQEHLYLTLYERVFSSEHILKLLTEQCINQNVSILLGIKINDLIIDKGKIKGIKYGTNDYLEAHNIILACNLGITTLLKSFDSFYTNLLKSRLDMMVYLPKAHMTRGLIFAEVDKPILMPAEKGSLGSYFGGIQPLIHGDRKFSVDFDKARNLVDMIEFFFNKEFINTEDAHFYMCGKTDYIGSVHTEKGFINPGFHIINHEEYDNIKGLYTVITGKMTLAFHASKEVSEKILNSKLDLVIPKKKCTSNITDMFTVAPWRNVQEI